MIKSFRGLLEPDTVTTIRLSTNDGLTGYKVNKFRAISYDPRSISNEAVLKLYTVPQATSGDKINFDDPTLLGVNFFVSNQANTYHAQEVIIFDNTKFNQDIYITCESTDGNMNFYLELEQVKLAKDEAAVTTLKDMRGRE
jgi:hypothetical protein